MHSYPGPLQLPFPLTPPSRGGVYGTILGHTPNIRWVGLIIFPMDYYKRYPRLLGGASEDIHRIPELSQLLCSQVPVSLVRYGHSKCTLKTITSLKLHVLTSKYKQLLKNDNARVYIIFTYNSSRSYAKCFSDVY